MNFKEPKMSRSQRKSWNRRNEMRHINYNWLPQPPSATIIGLSLLAFVALLILASCAATPKEVPAPCPAFPARPMLVLPEVGSFHKRLDSILTPKPTAPTN